MSKSISLGHGLRLHLSGKGVGISGGIPGLRVGVHSSGRRTLSVGIPGTGVAFRTASGGKRSSKQPAGIRAGRVMLARIIGTKTERAYVRGLIAMTNGDLIKARDHFAGASGSSAAFFAAYAESIEAPYIQRAIARLRALAPKEFPDARLARYMNGATVSVAVTPAVDTDVPVTKLAVVLLLAELLQPRDLNQAITVLERARTAPDVEQSHPAFVASLAELYAIAGRHDDVVTLTDELRNVDDLSCQTLVLRARALAAQEHHGGALAALKEALRSSKRDVGVLLAARYERALVYEEMGEHAKARKDFEAVQALDADYLDVGVRLAPVPRNAAPIPPAFIVRDARRRAGLSQAELARAVGVQQKTISRIETGASVPHRETVEKILRACSYQPPQNPW